MAKNLCRKLLAEFYHHHHQSHHKHQQGNAVHSMHHLDIQIARTFAFAKCEISPNLLKNHMVTNIVDSALAIAS